MTTPVTVERKARKRPKLRKLDHDKVVDLHERGFTMTEIAQHQRVNVSTIWRFIQRLALEKTHVEHFRTHQADALTLLRADSLEAMNGVTQSILRDLENGVLNAQRPSIKAGIFRDLSVSHGILHDKERLERGQSTSNISLVGRMMAEAHARIATGPPTGSAEERNS